MQRVSGANYAANAFGAGKNGYQDYNPSNGQAGTTPNASALNALQEEVASFIEARGLALNANDNTQLGQAIAAYVSQALLPYETAASEASDLANAIAGLDSPAEVAAAITAALANYAPLNSPPLTGTPTAPTPALGDNSTRLATTAFVEAAILGGPSQSWQNVTGSRNTGVSYTNTTGRPIMVMVSIGSATASMTPVYVMIGGNYFRGGICYGGFSECALAFVVPPGATYGVSSSNASMSTSGISLGSVGGTGWSELR